MHLKPVDLQESLELCVAFRRDAHLLSQGVEVEFNVEECIQWFLKITSDPSCGFEHLWLNDRIIGQIEYRSAIQKERECFGYINLLYLLPEYRGQGYGLQLQHYMFQQFIAQECSHAYLRYFPQNLAAGRFYAKHGWQRVGLRDAKGQVMINRFGSLDQFGHS